MAGCLNIGTNLALFLSLAIVLRIYYYFEETRKCSVRLKQENGGLRKATTNKTNSVALVRKRTIQTERPPLVGEVSATN
jgi:hypothetical protein